MNEQEKEALALYTPTEVARMFRVDPKTVVRWAKRGRVNSVILPNGRYRFRKEEIDKYLEFEYEGAGNVA